jgi:aryl-alcohol dehydrogenase-like predicted oxidoreductase
MERVILGRTGIEVPPLAIGTGSNGGSGKSDQTRLGHEELVNLLEYAYDQGVTWIDSADQYGSHPHVADFLRRVPRERVVITTKTTARTAEAAEADIERFRKELGVDQLDFLLLHCLFDPEWPTPYAPVMEVMTRAKERGHVRALGVSCHNFGAFERASREEWVEVVLARINHSNLHMDATWEEVSEVLRRMHAAGKGVYGMKVLGCGDLRDDPRRALEFVFGLGCVDAVTLGMVSREQVDQNVALVSEIQQARVTAGTR